MKSDGAAVSMQSVGEQCECVTSCCRSCWLRPCGTVPAHANEIVLQGMCMAVLQGGVLNLASLFPPIYIQVCLLLIWQCMAPHMLCEGCCCTCKKRLGVNWQHVLVPPVLCCNVRINDCQQVASNGPCAQLLVLD
jgi:hypothetical protein